MTSCRHPHHGHGAFASLRQTSAYLGAPYQPCPDLRVAKARTEILTFNLQLLNLRPSASPKTRLSPFFATDPRNRPLSPLVATLPKTPSRKSFICHTSD